MILEHGGPGLDASLLVTALRKGVPATVHVADWDRHCTYHLTVNGAALGQATLADFRICAAWLPSLRVAFGSTGQLPSLCPRSSSNGGRCS